MIIVELISDICTVGGGQTLVKNLSIELSKNKNNKIYLISLYPEKESPILHELKQKGIDIFFLNKRKGIDFSCASKLKKILIYLKPDVVHLHLNTFLTYYLTKLNDKYRLFYTFHTIILDNEKSIVTKIENKILKTMFKNHGMLPIAISTLVKESIEKEFNIKNIPVVENGIDVFKFKPKEDFFERKFDFAVIGSFSNVKNQLGILKLFKVLSDEGIHFKAVFIGDGELITKCKNYVKDNKLDNYITFTGIIENVEHYLKDSAFLVMKSLYEGNPMVINEAISCGVYVISNSVGGIPDIVNKNNGILCYDDKSFVDALNACFVQKYDILKFLKEKIEDNRNKVSIELTSKKYYYLFINKEKL